MHHNIDLYKKAFQEWNRDRVPMMSAALSYYMIFSIAPLVLIILSVAGFFFGKSSVEKEITKQAINYFGLQTGQVIKDLVHQTSNISNNILASIIGIITLIIGATGVFGNLKESLNIILAGKNDTRWGIKEILKTQTFSFLLVLILGIFLLVTLIVSTLLTTLSGYLNQIFAIPEELFSICINLFHIIFLSILLSAMYKILPDKKFAWNQIWPTGILIAVLFTIGKEIISIYIGWAITKSTYGAAGALVIILLWVYYSSQIFFYGAELIKCIDKNKK